MSQPRRRRRRRRGKGAETGGAAAPQGGVAGEHTGGTQDSAGTAPATLSGAPARRSSRKRRRGRARAQEAAPERSPQMSEDLVRRDAAVTRPATLTAAPDGQTLEDIIRELQSEWGVPQYPQEYRITIKIVEDSESRVQRSPSGAGARSAAASVGAAVESPPSTSSSHGAPTRERAPAAPRVAPEGAQDSSQGSRKRSRRRRRGRKGGRG